MHSLSGEQIDATEKITEGTMLRRLQPGEVLLLSLRVREKHEFAQRPRTGDARIALGLDGDLESFRFVVEAKTRGTPQMIELAVAQARSAVTLPGEMPMIFVPYLSEGTLLKLQKQGVSGIDLCGNGVVISPGRLYVFRSGQPNRFRESRPVSNPYRGRSGLVGRMLLTSPRWNSLGQLAAAVGNAGVSVSLAQVSKTVQALAEELIVARDAQAIVLRDPLRLLDQLGAGWRSPWVRARQAMRLAPNVGWAQKLSAAGTIQWAVTGESSVTRYTTFVQGGPRRIAVSDLPRAVSLLDGTREPIPNFADLELMESEEPGFFFANETDVNGVRWASRIQAWLELRSGGARQQNAAEDLRNQILGVVQP